MIHSPKHGRARRITAFAAIAALVALSVFLAAQAGATSTAHKGTAPAAAHRSKVVTVTVWEDLSTYGPKVPAMLNKLDRALRGGRTRASRSTGSRSRPTRSSSRFGRR